MRVNLKRESYIDKREENENSYKFKECSVSYLMRCLNAIERLRKEFFHQSNEYEYRTSKVSKGSKNVKKSEKYFEELYKDITNKINKFKKLKKEPLARLIKKYRLNNKESIIVFCLYDDLILGRELSRGSHLLRLISLGDPVKFIKFSKYLDLDSKLLKNNIVKTKYGIYGESIFNVFENSFMLGNLAINYIVGVKCKGSKKHLGKRTSINSRNILSPKQIYDELSKVVIGQENAKKIISVAVYNHYKRVFDNTGKCKNVEKSNIMLIGPTGCGKTLICKTLGKILDVPVAVVDATVFTETGYVGRNVEDMLAKLYQNSGNDLEKSQKGIIYIDEIDKIASRCIDGGHNSNRDVSGRSVQEEMLKILEPNIIKHADKGMFNSERFPPMDTTNILFIVGGAFDGLDKIVEKRVKKASIGFRENNNEDKKDKLIDKIITEDLVEYGMMPELLGRIPVICVLDELTEDELVEILKNPVNGLVVQYKNLFEINNINIEFTDESLREIARQAVEKGVGARGLKKIMEDILINPMFEMFNNKGDELRKFTIDYNFVKGN